MSIGMDSLEFGSSNNLSPGDFFNHVFNFDTENKANMLNLVQYILIGIIPVVLTLKAIKQYVPEEDEDKGNLEISLEVSLQLFAIFFSIWFIDRMIRYFPTYAGVSYHKFNELNFVLPLLIILVTMQTKLGAKINILSERIMDLWNGNMSSQAGYANQGAHRAGQQGGNAGIHQNSRADVLDNTMIAPPPQQMPPQANISMIDSLPNMVDSGGGGGGEPGLSSFQNQAINNSFLESMEPMAANGAFGDGFGSSF
tara:strand:+ start:201 stop:962 length:762 start_codon:yes stop_codon:yes gene_type:complete